MQTEAWLNAFRDGKMVAIHAGETYDYPIHPPFHPSEPYPEYAFGQTAPDLNVAYAAVRGTFLLAGLDRDNYGTPKWNPLGQLIQPGETVLLKPNMVKEVHPRDPDGWKYMLTHGSVIRAAADYVWKALEGRGRIVLADAPVTESSFQAMVRILGLDIIRDFYQAQGLEFELIDLRRRQFERRDGVIVRRFALPGDPRGSVAFDLAGQSEFVGHRGAGRYFGADYDEREVNRHHTAGRHEYLVARSVMESDVVLSLPKLKTHRKAGITVSLKNLVGVNADKNWLPHHTDGDPAEGGDEHPNPDRKHRAERTLVRYLRHLSLRLPGAGNWIHRLARRRGEQIFGDSDTVIRSGNWWGNDTIWRMCIDLNKILLYGNADGTLRAAGPKNRKRHYVLVDGIVAGEGRGPMNPDPVPAGVVLFALNPASADAASACIMGFDPERIPIVRQAFCCAHLPLTDWDWREVGIVSNRPEWCRRLPDIPTESTFHFEPHFGWKGRIERTASETQCDIQTGMTRF